MKFKFKLYNDLTLNKTLKFVRTYPHVFLDECLYKL